MAGCDTAWNQTRVCSDASSTEMQCPRPLAPLGSPSKLATYRDTVLYRDTHVIYCMTKVIFSHNKTASLFSNKTGACTTMGQNTQGSCLFRSITWTPGEHCTSADPSKAWWTVTFLTMDSPTTKVVVVVCIWEQLIDVLYLCSWIAQRFCSRD